MKLITGREFDSITKLESLFQIADRMVNPWQHNIDPYYIARGKVMAIVTSEPSTRTRLSFEIAMKKLGGEVCWMHLDDSSSSAKGETVEDSLKVVAELADLIILRHPNPDLIYWAKENISIPLINAGNGDQFHPTQALLDLYTIQKELGGVAGKHIVLCGDLTHSRTIHSLLYLLTLYPSVEITFVAPKGRDKLPNELNQHLKVPWILFDNLKDVLTHELPVDVIYMTRLQEERRAFWEMDKYPAIDGEILGLLPKHAIILHPLPRLQEIPVWVDKLPCAAYFRQVKYGMYLRMGLLCQIFAEGKDG